ncbi:MAG: hypothetical protein K2Y37_03445 [Pirellulales bacterium]|nr:hypothetical protein [Pirellulales bacterium]
MRVPSESRHPFQFTLRKALLAFVILSPCMLVLSAILLYPEWRIAIGLLTVVSLLVTALCGVVAGLIVFSIAITGRVQSAFHHSRSKRANVENVARNEIV